MKSKHTFLILLLMLASCAPTWEDIIIYDDLTPYKRLYREEGLARHENFYYPNIHLTIGTLPYPSASHVTKKKVTIDRDWYLWHTDVEREILIFREMSQAMYGLDSLGIEIMKDPILDESYYSENRERILDEMFEGALKVGR